VELPPPSDEIEARPWGLWATVGFSTIIFGVFCAIQILIVIFFLSSAKTQHPELDLEVYVRSLSSNGLCLTVMAVVSGLVCIPLTLWFANLRKSVSVKNYIGFKEPSKSEWVKWLLALAAFLFLSEMVSLLLHRPIVHPFMIEAYKTASFLPGLLFAMIIVAPIFEEIFFRGFLFQGIRYSRLGPIGAIGITSLFWAVMHVQYDVYGITTLFALGLFLGISRLKKDSIHLLMVMHSLVGLVASVETILYVHFTG
jgi:membrane protease YdiL (CAAX protease family)